MPLWPLYVPSRSPLSAYQTLGWLSLAAVKRRSPSRLYFTIVSGRVCPWMMIGRTPLCDGMVAPAGEHPWSRRTGHCEGDALCRR